MYKKKRMENDEILIALVNSTIQLVVSRVHLCDNIL